MNGRLSCVSNVGQLQESLGVTLKHPSLYEPKAIIDCNRESTHHILLSSERPQLLPAIWSLLPNNFDRDWDTFQSVVKSAYLHENDLYEKVWWADAMLERRCLIPVTGFYTTFVSRSDTLTYRLGFDDNRPFYLAGIYNTTADGFLTFAIFLKNSPDCLRNYQNVSNHIPVVVEKKYASNWLDGNHMGTGICQDDKIDQSLRATSIPTDLFINDITYDGLFEPHRKEQTKNQINSFFYNK